MRYNPARVLKHFPYYYRHAREWRQELESPLQAVDYSRDRILNTNYINDLTGTTGIRLAEISELEKIIDSIGRWVNGLEHYDERRLLLAVWRTARLGFPWRYTSRDAGLNPTLARLIWASMVARLEAYLNDKRTA